MASPQVRTLPDIEDLLSEITILDDIPTIGKLAPSERADEFFRVERTGGVRLSPISDQPIVVLEAWALDDDRAIELLNIGRKVYAELAGTRLGDCAVKSVRESGGVVNLPDPLSNQSRYTITFTFHVKGVMS